MYQGPHFLENNLTSPLNINFPTLSDLSNAHCLKKLLWKSRI